MSSLYGCDRELMYEITQLEELNCFPNYSLTDTAASSQHSLANTMPYSPPEQRTNISTFENIPLNHWTSQNCMEWAENICYQHSLDKFSVDIGALSNSNGSHLIQSSLQDFCLMFGDYYGNLFYRELQALKNAHQVVASESLGHFVSGPELDTFNSVNYDYSQEFYDTNFNMHKHNQEEFKCSSYADNSNLYGYSESFDSCSAIRSNPGDTMNDKYENYFNLDTCQNDDSWNFDDDSLDNIQLYDLDSNHSIGRLSIDMGILQLSNNPDNQNDFMELVSKSSCQTKMVPDTAERKQKRKKVSKNVPVSDNTVQELCKMVPGSGKYIRCPKSWEFLMRLLVNSETNPDVICWEDEAQYIFRLVAPTKIIELWSAKAGKSSGNYDNFARSLRYHYKKGILFPVPEKQLVYRCGPLAIEYLNQLKSQ